MRKSANDKPRKLALNRETVKLICEQDLSGVAGGAWSGWSVTVNTPPTCFT
jgi:hypothetical protein